MRNSTFFAVAAMAAMSLPMTSSHSAILRHVPRGSRGEPMPLPNRRGESVNPLELHKLARKNKRRGR